MLEDYRAGLTVELRHEQEDRTAGRRVTGPPPAHLQAFCPAAIGKV